MSKGTLGSFNGTTTPNVNMIDVFKKQEIEKHENSFLKFSEFMIVKKLGIQCDAGTVIEINGAEFPVPPGGVFELGYGQIDVTSLVFKSAVSVNIYYMY